MIAKQESGMNAIDRFWREAADLGTSLVEPVGGDQENVLVTFLFRGGEDIRSFLKDDKRRPCSRRDWTSAALKR